MKKALLPPTAQRVSYHTRENINSEIRNQTIHCLNTYKDSNETILSDKIKKLNSEWDIERFLETKAASIMLASSILGYKKSKCCWFFLTGAVGLFLLQQALQGWCPPVPAIRRMGVRTAEEINNEKTVFKFIRGDFSQNTNDVNEMLTMAEKQ